MNFQACPKPVVLFLLGLGLAGFPFFTKVVYGGDALPTVKPSPTPAYVLEMQTMYPPNQDRPVRISVSLEKGPKTLWSHGEPYPIKSTVVIQESGRSFLELVGPQTLELRVYARKGNKLLDKKVVPRAVSFKGDFIAYDESNAVASGPVTTTVYSMDRGTMKKFKLLPGSRVMALSADGKNVLIWNQDSGTSESEYDLVDEGRKRIWIKKGPNQFLAMGNKGQWLLWADQKGNKIECSDFKTGKTVREFSKTVFNMLYKQFPETRAFR